VTVLSPCQTKCVFDRMKNSSGANQSGALTQKTPTTPTTPNSVGFRKFALAEFRYGKEDMLTLYAADNLKLSNDVVQSVSLITSEVVTPMAFLPFTEEEQVVITLIYMVLLIWFYIQILFAGCVNSNNSLRLAGRGSGPPTRGGRGGRGRGESFFFVFCQKKIYIIQQAGILVQIIFISFIHIHKCVSITQVYLYQIISNEINA